MLRLFEVVLALFIAGFLLNTLYPWLSQWNRLLGILLTLLAIMYWLQQGGGFPAEVLLFAAFIGWGALTGLLLAEAQGPVRDSVRLLAQEAALLFAVAVYVARRGKPTIVFLFLLVVPLGLGWFSHSTGELAAALSGDTVRRLVSFAGNENFLGFLCLYAVFGVAYLLWHRGKQKLTLWPLLVLPLIGAILVLSGSRKSILSVGFFALAWAAMAYGRARISRFRRALILLMVVAGLFMAGRSIVERAPVGGRFESVLSDPSASRDRLELYREGWSMFLDAPINGVGLGNFTLRSSMRAYAHSDFMEVLATTGVVGFLLYFSVYLVLWRRLRRVLNARSDPTSRYTVGLYQAMIITLLLLGLGTPNFLNPVHLLLIGVMVGHTRAMERNLRSVTPAEGGAVGDTTTSSPAVLRRTSRLSP
ncbi:MAG: O-antigen ligase family protein [candidate division WOR-3 bacterium]|nr:MAG: O-antigen ligase family protein [candidate division WOR-3 bacterium]